MSVTTGAKPLQPDRHPATPAATAPAHVPTRTMGQRGLAYIPALDGVRAIAVTAVLIFHGNPDWLPGGFLGVDVFFVLSGFLITSILLTELEKTGRIGFGQFYLRRARRLLPALLLVLATSTALVLILAHDAAARLRDDILGSLAYVTNWVNIFHDQSYFEATGRPPLLQHLWSLGLEEQFYFIWPLVLLLAFRSRGRFGVRRVALIGAGLSTLLMLVLSIAWNMPGGADPSRLYFGSDTHAMTILVGAALATTWRPSRLPKRLPAQPTLVLTLIGAGALAAIVGIFVSVYSNSPALYRGGFLVFAVLCAVLIAILSHPAVSASRFLGMQPFTYIGQRSYGLYLWHWPIFMVTRPGIDNGLTGIVAFTFQLSLTVVAAELSYRFIEMPIRDGSAVRAWQGLRERDPGRATRNALITGVAVAVTIIGFALGLSAIKPVDASTYLGGVTAMGNENLKPLPGSPTSGAAGPLTNVPAPPLPQEDLTQRTITAMGDSVMLGAFRSMQHQLPKVTVDAAISRQVPEMVSRMKDRRLAGTLGDVVVFHGGTNGPVTKDQLRQMLGNLADRTRVVMVTTHMPDPWMKQSNTAILAMAAEFPNVRIADWAAAATGHREYFVADGTHLTTRGVKAYAATLVAGLQAS